MAIKKNNLVKKAYQDYEYLTGDAAVRRLQELREKAILDENSAYETGRNRGREEGREEGKALGEARGEIRGRIATAKAMMQKKIKMNIIAECTGLSEEELKKIADSMISIIG